MNNSKLYYTARELLSLNLKDLPITVKGIIQKANRENWVSRPRQARGGGYEYALTSLPPAVQAAILLKTKPAPAPLVVKGKGGERQAKGQVVVAEDVQTQLSNLSAKQRSIIDARTTIVAKLNELLALPNGMGKTETYQQFAQQLKNGELPEFWLTQARIANAKPSGKRAISMRTLQQ